MGKLLLRADGVLAENWCPLDPEPPYEPPERWDARHVQYRFTEAIDTLRKLPLGKFFPDEIRGSWPTYTQEWDAFMARMSADLEQMAGEGSLNLEFATAFHDWTENRNRFRRRPTGSEISAMETSLLWPGRYLYGRSPDLLRALNLIALARVRNVSIRAIVRGGKHAGVRSASEWQQLGFDAAHQIAVGLRVDKVAVF
jgi:hypothetical protein